MIWKLREHSTKEEQLVIFEPTMEAMGAVERPMMENSFPTADGTTSSIVKPAVEANNFEIKPAIIQIIRSSVQLSGLPDEDPNKHLVNFLEICDTFRFNGLDRESLYDTWERFKSMLRKCPHHELPVWRQVQTFYNGVTLANRATIDAAAGGTIMKKLPSEAFNIIDEIATNLYSYGQERAENRIADIHSIDAISALSAQMNAQMTTLTHRMDNLGAAIWSGAPVGPCGACGQMGHLSQDCQVQPPQEKKSNIEDVLSKFITAAEARFHSQEASIRNIEVQIGQLMPSYAKFLKEVISNKRKWENGETVKLNEECSAILQNKLPPKLKDPGSFSIPCTIGEINFEKALCDLGASINWMPYSIFAKLGMHELTPTIVTFQLADKSIKYPRGIIEDVLVKVGKFVIPVDFVVLDMEEDANTPLILGRPFLATGKALIDVQKGQLTLRINDEEVTFNVFKAIKHPQVVDHEAFSIDCIEMLQKDCMNLSNDLDPITDCIVNSDKFELQGRTEEHRQALCHLDAEREEISSRPRRYLPLGGPPISELKSSIEKPTPLELKPLPSHLKYVFIGEDETLPVIISSYLTGLQEEKLKRVLRENIKAIG
ncbi:UNVERIFIED_CONTAM: hypothetical protein Sradi_1762400 [Sesamum radiatum]|uniref:CCHC-type domain-containing protein n=1 Tax=Sesamum radiatum TaxID=300843 RepID=A0AAW2TTH8_SESRA